MLSYRRFLSLAVILSCLFFNMSGHSSSSPQPVKVAVIDTGIDRSHPYLKPYMWVNAGETGLDSKGRNKADNGIDDDGNGYIDDAYGWNSAEQNDNVRDEDGHGTHIAGVITKVILQQKNIIPFQLMPIRYFSKSSSPRSRTDAFIDALEYAVKMKADIINISGGGPAFNERELAVLKRASAQGILIVASAGNKKRHAEDKLFYPAGYDLPNILSVIATDQWGKVLATSNVNPQKTNVYADGDRIESSLPHNRFGKKTGSSQAAAVFTGYVVKYISEGKLFNIAELRTNFSLVNNSTQGPLFVSNSAN